MRIGVDLGGTKIEAVALDDQGTMLTRQRVPTPQHDYDATVAAIAGLGSVVDDGENIHAPSREAGMVSP